MICKYMVVAAVYGMCRIYDPNCIEETPMCPYIWTPAQSVDCIEWHCENPDSATTSSKPIIEDVSSEGNKSSMDGTAFFHIALVAIFVFGLALRTYLVFRRKIEAKLSFNLMMFCGIVIGSSGLTSILVVSIVWIFSSCQITTLHFGQQSTVKSMKDFSAQCGPSTKQVKDKEVQTSEEIRQAKPDHQAEVVVKTEVASPLRSKILPDPISSPSIFTDFSKKNLMASSLDSPTSARKQTTNVVKRKQTNITDHYSPISSGARRVVVSAHQNLPANAQTEENQTISRSGQKDGQTSRVALLSSVFEGNSIQTDARFLTPSKATRGKKREHSLPTRIQPGRNVRRKTSEPK